MAALRLIGLIALGRGAGPAARAALRPALRGAARRCGISCAAAGGAGGESVRAALRAAAARLAAAGVPEPDASAEHLLAHALGSRSRGVLAARADEPLAPAQAAHFASMVCERLDRKPVQMIVGEWSFLELTLAVRAPTLVPRPETEELVELALERCAALRDGGRPPRVLDVGCGTGAIGLAILARRPLARCTAIDIAEEAVSLARHNAALLGLEARYEALLLPIERLGAPTPAAGGAGAAAGLAAEERYDVLLSNPPYIPERDMASLEPEVSAWEDWRALCGGRDGLDVVAAILERAPSLLRAPGCELWLEVDPSHPALIRAWLDARPHSRLEFVECMRDFGGHERFCRLRVVAGPDGGAAHAS